eukprot:UN01690
MMQQFLCTSNSVGSTYGGTPLTPRISASPDFWQYVSWFIVYVTHQGLSDQIAGPYLKGHSKVENKTTWKNQHGYRCYALNLNKKKPQNEDFGKPILPREPSANR